MASGGIVGLRYTWGPGTDNLLAIEDAAHNHYYVVQDFLHSIRGLVKRDSTWTMSQRFGPYGAVIGRDTNSPGPGFAVRYGWTGREYDPEIGWYFFRARSYDLGAKRFVQEDPIGGGGNVYAYGDGAPLEGRDPSGLAKSCDAVACGFDPNDGIKPNTCLDLSLCGDTGAGEGHYSGEDWNGDGIDDEFYFEWTTWVHTRTGMPMWLIDQSLEGGKSGQEVSWTDPKGTSWTVVFPEFGSPFVDDATFMGINPPKSLAPTSLPSISPPSVDPGCPGGFLPGMCSQLFWAHRQLELMDNELCQGLGASAQVRFDNGLYVFQLDFKNAAWTIRRGGVMDPRTWFSLQAFSSPATLRGIVAHEELHHWGIPDGPEADDVFRMCSK